MTGKTAGQLLHESLCETAVTEFDMPIEAFDTWDQMRESQRKRMEAAAAAVETGQLRLAREDRDQLRKQVLDLAAELERLAGEHSQKAAEYDRDAARENFHRGCSAGLGNAAGRIRYAAGPPS